MILNVFEESSIKNNKLPEEWQSQASLDELVDFLQTNWEQRGVFYEDGKINSRQQFLGFKSKKGIREQRVSSNKFNRYNKYIKNNNNQQNRCRYKIYR